MIHTRLDDFLQRDSYGKKSPGDQSISYDTITVTTPASACAFEQVCLHMCEKCPVDNRQLWQWVRVKDRTRKDKRTLCVWPRIPYTPVWLWNDRQSFYTVHQAHQIFRPWCKMLQKGSLLKGSCHFLRLRSLIVGRIHFSRSNSINLSLVYLNHVFLNQSRMLTE